MISSMNGRGPGKRCASFSSDCPAIVLVLALMLGGPAWAADIQCGHLPGPAFPRVIGPPCTAIWIDGMIVPGDYDRFRAVVRGAEPRVVDVYLRSRGGNIREAMRIGRLVRQRFLGTAAALDVGNRLIEFGSDGCSLDNPTPCLCASSCFLIWAAGVDRFGNALALHRPYNVTGELGSMKASDVSRDYAAVLTEMDRYLTEMEIPRRYIEEMLATPSDKPFMPTRDEARQMVGKPPSINEWLLPSCGSQAPEFAFDDPNYHQKLRLDRVFMCGADRIQHERERLAKDSPLR